MRKRLGHIVGELGIAISVAARDATHARAAAACLMRDQPELQITLDDDGISISGVGDEAEVRQRWLVALLNERLVARAAARRAELLRTLVA